LVALLHNPKIRAIEETENETDKTYLALSDIHSLLSARSVVSRRPACKLAAQKILYYASNLDNFDREHLQSEVLKRKHSIEMEELDVSQFEKDVVDRKNIGGERILQAEVARSDRPKIEEIGG